VARARQSRMGMRIELGRPEDLERFIDLLEAAAAWLWDREIRQWEPGSLRAQGPILSRWTRSGCLVLARTETDLAGGCFLVSDPTPEWEGRARSALYLHKLVVALGHAGRGVASRRASSPLPSNARETPELPGCASTAGTETRGSAPSTATPGSASWTRCLRGATRYASSSASWPRPRRPQPRMRSASLRTRASSVPISSSRRAYSR
jgi:hypothetical protein